MQKFEKTEIEMLKCIFFLNIRNKNIEYHINMKNTSFFIILNFIKKIKIDTTICVSLKKKIKK